MCIFINECKMLRKVVTCSSCLQEGHMKNSERCVLYRAKLNNIHNIITDDIIKTYFFINSSSERYLVYYKIKLKCSVIACFQ